MKHLHVAIGIAIVGMVVVSCSSPDRTSADPPSGVSSATIQTSSPSAPATSTPPTSSPEPIPPSAQRLPGVDGWVCAVSSAFTDFSGHGGATDRVYVFSKVEDGSCQHLHAFVGVAPHDGRVVASSSGYALCHGYCRLVALPDVNGDGIAEMAVGDAAYGSAFFDLFMVQRGPLTVTRMHGAGGGGREFAVGGTDQSMWGLICAPGATLMSWGAAETAEGNGPYSVQISNFDLHGPVWTVGSVTRSYLPQDATESLPEHGGVAFGVSHGICGYPILPRKFYR